MKQSHFQAPRNLADCQFTTGYGVMPYRRYSVRQVITAVLAWIGVLSLFAAMGVMLALGF